jgi:hypothetical protein
MCPAMDSSQWDMKNLEFFWSQTAPVPLTTVYQDCRVESPISFPWESFGHKVSELLFYYD